MANMNHVLMTREFGVIKDWTEWKQRWDEADTAEVLLGLVYCGFHVPLTEGYDYEKREELKADRICFYLEIADGHAGWDLMHEHERGEWNLGDEGTLPHRRQAIAARAFGHLAKFFFTPKNSSDRSNWWNWEDVLTNDRLFQKVLWFLRTRWDVHQFQWVLQNIQPFPQREASAIAWTFAKRFMRLLWETNFYPLSLTPEKKEEAMQRLRGAQTAAMDILLVLGMFEEILLNKYRSPTSAVVVEKLTRLALQKWPDRMYASLDEALLEGSPAARVLVLLKAMEKAKRRAS
ncbi:MAG: hypothetical protein KW806_00505 [Candidatus Yanofskybacteria bacterium]|nr:hypothetical protein [Candidatus Yanofskybacteria bacterium]